MLDLLSPPYDRRSNWHSTIYSTPIPQAAFKYFNDCNKPTSWHWNLRSSGAVVSSCKWAMLITSRLMQLSQFTLKIAQEQLGTEIPPAWPTVQECYKGVNYNISNNPCKAPNDAQCRFWWIPSSHHCTYRARCQRTPWWDQVSHLSIGIWESWSYQVSFCPLVQVAAVTGSDRAMQVEVRMKRVFRSIFVVCKCTANSSACF